MNISHTNRTIKNSKSVEKAQTIQKALIIITSTKDHQNTIHISAIHQIMCITKAKRIQKR